MFVSSKVARKGFALLMATAMVVPVLLTVAPVALAVDDTPSIAGTWSGSGPGITSVVHNGTGGLAEFTYNDDRGTGGGVPLETWDFHTTAATAGTVNLAYAFEGSTPGSTSPPA